MKAKKKNKSRIVLNVQQKQTFYYAVAGVALALIGGVILFFYLNVGNADDTYAANGSDYTVGSGFWDNNSIWNSGTNPGTTAISKDIQIFRNVTSLADLTFGNHLTLTITDTLVVNGDLTIGNNSDLVIGTNGVLIVTGNFSADNRLVIGSGGIIAIGGAADFGNNLNYEDNGGAEIYVGGPITNGEDLEELTKFEDLPTAIRDVINGTNTTLPITLLSFDATVQQQSVLLKWVTESELNNDYFTIERSTDGQQAEEVGTLPGAGTTQTVQSYSFVDENPLPGTSYYRLRQTDFDGRTEAFDWVAVSFENGNGPLTATPVIEQVFPNPVVTECRVSFTLGTAGAASLEVIDMQGNTLLSRVVSGQAGHNEHTLENLQRLQPGTYLLRLVHRGEASPVYRILKR